MAETVRRAQPIPLEVPVTIQGSKSVEGTDKRELFVETTKTTLVFENGAALNLKSKLMPGQCVFLRNEVTGKEILCKVLESPQDSQPGYTDLEFNVYEPEFWGNLAELPADSGQKPEAQKPAATAGEKTAAGPKIEAGEPASTEIPATPPKTGAIEPASLEATEALPERANETQSSATSDAQDAAQPAKQETAAQESQETEPRAAAKDAAEEIESISEIESEKEGSYASTQEPIRIPNFKARKIAAAISVAAAIIVVTVQVYEWRARYKHVNQGSHRAASSVQAKHQSSNDKTLTSQSPTTADSSSQTASKSGEGAVGQGSSDAAGTAPTAVGQKAQQPGTKQGPGAVTTQNPHGPAEARVAAKRGKSSDPNAGEMIPARILSESQPPIPPWAKTLDLDDVVQLDAVIDEKGNVTSTRPLSGPRLLQHEAERAVALWIFEPAIAGGKPTATHMVLTVQFQR